MLKYSASFTPSTRTPWLLASEGVDGGFREVTLSICGASHMSGDQSLYFEAFQSAMVYSTTASTFGYVNRALRTRATPVSESVK